MFLRRLYNILTKPRDTLVGKVSSKGIFTQRDVVRSAEPQKLH